MTEQNQPDTTSQTPRSTKKRNVILAIVLLAASLTMYASIFLRLYENPLSY